MNGCCAASAGIVTPVAKLTTHLVKRRNRRRLSEISWSAGVWSAEAKRYGTITREKSHVLTSTALSRQTDTHTHTCTARRDVY